MSLEDTMYNATISKNQETGSAFLSVYNEEGNLVIGIDVRADGSMEVHNHDGVAGFDHIACIHDVLSQIAK
jgi:hypothetical protein